MAGWLVEGGVASSAADRYHLFIISFLLISAGK